MSGYLAHHGRLGQKWGKKNGPPYPLNYNDLSAEERDKAKGEAISNGNIKEAYQNRKYFTNQEIDATISRFRKENELLSMIPKELQKTGTEKIKEIGKTLSEIASTANRVADVTEGATKAYNALAKVLNTFAGTDLSTIKDKEKTDPYSTKKFDYGIKKEQYNQEKIKTEKNQYLLDELKEKKKGSK